MPDYEKLTVIKLRDELVARGLSKAGLKAALVQRLNEADAQSERTEPAANESSKRRQDDESRTGAPTRVPQAVRKSESKGQAADSTPQSFGQQEDQVEVADTGDGPPLYKPDEIERAQYQTGQMQEDENLQEQAPNTLTESSSSNDLIPNGMQSGDMPENPNGNMKEPEVQLPISVQNQTGDVQGMEDKAGMSTQTSLLGDELLEDSHKRKRRSQSPPPSSVENTQKKLKANNGRPLVQLPEDTTEDYTNQQGPGDQSLGPEPTNAQESGTQNNSHTGSNETSKLANISTSTTVGWRDTEGVSSQQTQSFALEELDPMKERNVTPTHVKSFGSPIKSSPSDTRFRNLFPTPAHLEHASHHPNAEETPVSPALHPATSALYIRELMRPLKLENLRDHLIALATPPDTTVNPNIVTDFFLDSIRTHCLVGFENISAASRVRSGLHDRVWPNERDRRQLWVDFVPEEKLESWIDVERTAGSGRGHPSKRWEVVYEVGQSGINASLREVGSNSRSLRTVKPSRLDADQSLQVTGPRISGSEPRNTQPRPDSGKGFQALDDLFTSTVAKPKLYYMPVSKAEADRRTATLAAGRGGGRGGGRGNEMRRFSFEEGSIVDNGPEFGRGGGHGRGGSYAGSYRGRVRAFRADASRGDSWKERRLGY